MSGVHPEMVRQFCELTIANEIDVIAPDREGYLARWGRYVVPLFTSARFRRNLSGMAAVECERHFPEVLHERAFPPHAAPGDG